MTPTETESIRSFLAVLLPATVRRRLDAEIAALRTRAPRIAWVRAENLHVTLRFLGAVDAATLARAREAVEVATAATAAFAVTLGGLGGFPPSRAPRVLWAGVTVGADALTALHARLEEALAERGIPREGRAFHAHVTLGRTRAPGGAPELARALAEPTGELGQVRVNAVHLMRSELAPGGARYGILAEGRLRGQKGGDPSHVDIPGSGP